MTIQNYVVIILGASLAAATLAILPSDQISQNTFAQMDIMSDPTGANVTDGNMIGAEEEIPTANITAGPIGRCYALPDDEGC
jgi:hypothetical protein